MAHKQAQNASFDSPAAVAFVIGVAVTLLVLWMLNVASNGRMIQTFFGGSTPVYTQQSVTAQDQSPSTGTTNDYYGD